MISKEMVKKIENLINRLNSKIAINKASTGTIYLQYQGDKIRIANHEANYGLRGHADLEIYTHDPSGILINDEFVVLKNVATFWKIPITGALKASVTKHDAKKQKEKLAYEKLKKQQIADDEKRKQALKTEKEKIKTLIKGRENEVKAILKDADEYAKTGSNGDKRRKLKRSYFNRTFKAQFGFEVEKSIIETILTPSV